MIVGEDFWSMRTKLFWELYRSSTEFPDNCYKIPPLKATIYRAVFVCKHESFAGAVMPRRFPRTVLYVAGLIWRISVHIFYKFTGYRPMKENLILSKPGCRHGSPTSTSLCWKTTSLINRIWTTIGLEKSLQTKVNTTRYQLRNQTYSEHVKTVLFVEWRIC